MYATDETMRPKFLCFLNCVELLSNKQLFVESLDIKSPLKYYVACSSEKQNAVKNERNLC